jgi:tyrosine-protein phosphatase SIW14
MAISTPPVEVPRFVRPRTVQSRFAKHRAACALQFAFAVSLCAVAVRPLSVAQAPAAAPSGQAEKIQVGGISNAGKVHPFLYRGSQPNAQGVEELKKLGVDTIVDLRGEKPSTMKAERQHAEALGMHLINIEGNGWSPPRDEQMVQFLSLFQETPQHKVFVHCWFGQDRTGVFVAAYRIAYDGWTPEQALQEMYSFHFKSFWHPAMKAYILDFPARIKRTPALAALQQNKGQPSN